MAQACGLSRNTVHRIWRASPCSRIAPRHSSVEGPAFIEKVGTLWGVFESPRPSPGAPVRRESQSNAGSHANRCCRCAPGQVERRTMTMSATAHVAVRGLDARAAGSSASCNPASSHRVPQIPDTIDAAVPTELGRAPEFSITKAPTRPMIHRWLAPGPGSNLHFTRPVVRGSNLVDAGLGLLTENSSSAERIGARDARARSRVIALHNTLPSRSCGRDADEILTSVARFVIESLGQDTRPAARGHAGCAASCYTSVDRMPRAGPRRCRNAMKYRDYYKILGVPTNADDKRSRPHRRWRGSIPRTSPRARIRPLASRNSRRHEVLATREAQAVTTRRARLQRYGRGWYRARGPFEGAESTSDARRGLLRLFRTTSETWAAEARRPAPRRSDWRSSAPRRELSPVQGAATSKAASRSRSRTRFQGVSRTISLELDEPCAPAVERGTSTASMRPVPRGGWSKCRRIRGQIPPGVPRLAACAWAAKDRAARAAAYRATVPQGDGEPDPRFERKGDDLYRPCRCRPTTRPSAPSSPCQPLKARSSMRSRRRRPGGRPSACRATACAPEGRRGATSSCRCS